MSRRRIKAPCFDCGVDTLAANGDWYMVHNHLWKLAWPNTKQASGRAKKPLSEILCRNPSRLILAEKRDQK
jgi:hypothetical protein